MSISLKNIERPQDKVQKQQKKIGNFTFDFSFGTKISDTEKESFYSMIYTLLDSGVNLPNAIHLYIHQVENKKTKEVFQKISKDIVEGVSFSNSLKDSGFFEPYEYFNISIGEETGRLNDVLLNLKNYYENKIRQYRKIKGVLVYPAVVLTIAVGAVWFLLSYVVPLFQDVYNRFGGQLPAITRFIISLSDFLKTKGYLFLGIALGLFALRKYAQNKYWYQKFASHLLLRIPTVGKIVKEVYLARFCSSMSLMLHSGIPFVKSLDMASKMVSFLPLQELIPSISDAIVSGKLVHESFAKHPFFSQQMITLIRTGEEVKKLDVIFGKLSKTYEENVEHKINILNTLIEPFIIVFLGVVIGFILVAMYLPLFSLGNQMGV